MRLGSQFRAGLAALCIAGLIVPPGLTEQTTGAHADGPLSVRVAQSQDFSRIEFRWAGGARVSSHREAVTRELNSLTRAGLIARRRGAIVLLDATRLRRMVSEATEG